MVDEFQASAVIFGTDGDESGERLAVRDRIWLSGDCIESLGTALGETFRSAVSAPGTAVEVDVVLNGAALVFRGGSRPGPARGEAERLSRHIEASLPQGGRVIFDPLRMRADWPPSPEAPARARYENPPTVVVMQVADRRGLVMVRRGLRDGYGKLALPGGHQAIGETWQEAGIRELREETGLSLHPGLVTLDSMVTVPSGHNLVFARYGGVVEGFEPRTDKETLEVVFSNAPVETAFPAHTDAVRRFFA